VIVLVRHGETDANHQGLLLGRADPDLNETGRAQARRLAVALDGTEPIAIVTSPLARTRETAAAIGEQLKHPVDIDDRLIELDYGEWDGRPLADVPLEMWVGWLGDPGFEPPGGESLAALQARVEPCAHELLERSRDGVIIAVSHVSPIKAAVAWALGGGPELSWRMRLDVASITRIAHGRTGPVLAGFNEHA
jgi:broad specificity phosphatase PhoE